MPDQTSRILKFACLVLAVLVLYRTLHVLPRVNLLGHVAIPALPTLASDTNAPPTGQPAINSRPPAAQGTNRPDEIAKTNPHPLKSGDGASSNSVVAAQPAQANNDSATGGEKSTNSTNVSMDLRAATTNSSAETNVSTAAVESSTNASGTPASGHPDENGATNLVTATNAILPPNLADRSNAVSNFNAGTNANSLAGSKPKGGNPMGRGGAMMAAMGFNPRGRGLPELPAEIKARVDRIFESEILAQAMRPLPMGLIGIAGDVAFLRSAGGQTGLVKEGDSLGDLKLLRIGTNRVLVEQAGQMKELMIFEGYGGKSLLPEKGKQPE